MYNFSYLRDFNIVSKLLSFFIFVLSLFFLESRILFVVVICFYLWFFKSIPFFLVETSIFFLSFLFQFSLGLLKFVLLMQSIFFLVTIVRMEEVRVLIEKITYKFHSSRPCMMMLSFCYFCRLFCYKFLDFKKIYLMQGKKLDLKQYIFIVRKSYEKTKVELTKVMRTYEYRFYHVSKNRTYLEDLTLTSSDVKLVLVYVMLFFFVFVYGR